MNDQLTWKTLNFIFKYENFKCDIILIEYM